MGRHRGKPKATGLVFKPHPGQQQKYFQSTADIILAGGGAGGGKTMSLLIDAVIGTEYPDYSAALFRKQLQQHKMGGGLRQESMKYYHKLGGEFNRAELMWEFPSGANVKMYGCDDPSKYDGLQCEFLGIDQLEQLGADEFWHLRSRVRSASGRKCRVRATANPEPGWLERMLKDGGYVDEKTGLPIDEMDGVVRWFVRDPKTDKLVWCDNKEDFGELDEEDCITQGVYKGLSPSSFTFIRFRLSDNPALPKEYKANLQTMTLIERRKKLEGNWNQWLGGGGIYRIEWWGLSPDDVWYPSDNRLEQKPEDRISWCWAWDIGWSTTGDWTVGALVGQGVQAWYLGDGIRFRCREHVTFEAIRRCSVAIGKEIPIVMPKDPGKAGLDQEGWQVELGQQGHIVYLLPDDGIGGDKVSRHRFLSPQAQQGHFKVITNWRPSHAVSKWLLTQESEPGKPVECTTAHEYAREFILCMDALGPDCAHYVTDVTDAIARGHRFITQEDHVGAMKMADVMTPASTWDNDDPRRLLSQQAMSQWRRNINYVEIVDSRDFMFCNPRRRRF